MNYPRTKLFTKNQFNLCKKACNYVLNCKNSWQIVAKNYVIYLIHLNITFRWLSSKSTSNKDYLFKFGIVCVKDCKTG